MLAIAALLVGAVRPVAARDATVTATTPTTVYVDAGIADGLAIGRTWTANVGGVDRELRVVAAASHSALVELVGGPVPAVGATIQLPADLGAPPAAVAVRPPPSPMPTWRDDPAALRAVQRAAQRDEAAAPSPGTASSDRVRGEIALTAFVAGDAGQTSTSWQDLALSSQLEVIHGAWQYDHVLDAHLTGAPEVFYAPLQHAAAHLDVYLLRLAYAPAGARYAASLGRQPGAPLGELGSVDGGRARLVLGAGTDVTVFGGLRPADDLGLSSAPRAGADLGWSYARGPGVRARGDLGVAIDASGGALDRVQTAGSLSIARGVTFLRGDGVIDLAPDATDRAGTRLTRASGLVRTKLGRLTATGQGGYDRPFLDHALAGALGDLAGLRLGPRTFAEGDVRYAMPRGFDLGGAARSAWGEDVWSGYAEVSAAWTGQGLHLDAAPHAVIGTLTDELGVRAGVDLPVLRWQLGVGGSLDRVTAGVATAWAGLGRISASRTFRERWRTALSVESALGDGPPRVLVFALLGYRIGD